MSDATAATGGDGRARPPRRGHRPRRGRPVHREPLVRVGSVPGRARLGHRARGLQRQRGRLELLPARPRPLARLPVERGRHGRALGRPPRPVPGALAVERRRPDPQGADVRADGAAGQPRRGRQGALVVPRRAAQPRPAALALSLPPGRVPVPAADRRERPPHPGRVRVRAARHRCLRRRPLLDRRRHVRQGHPHRGAGAHRRAQPRARRGRHRRAPHAVVPQHVAVVRPRRRPRPVARRRRHGRRPSPPRRLPAGGRPRPRRCPAAGAVLRQRDQHRPAVRSGADHAVPEGRDQRSRRVRGRHRQPRPDGHEGGVVVPPDRPRGWDGGAAAPAGAPRAGQIGCVRRPAVGRGVGRGRGAPAGRGRRVLRRPRARTTSTPSACGSCGRPAPGSSGASRSTRTGSATGSTATPASRRPLPGTAVAATPAGGTSTRSTCWPCRIRGSTRGSPPGTSPSTRSPGLTSIRPSPSTSCSCCSASGSSTPTAPSPPTSGTSTT